MTVRQTPFIAECHLCGAPMAAIRGPFSKNIGRPKPPMGYRLGYVRETGNRELPMCAECVAYSLPSNITPRENP